ncbi:hypothetical protein EVAR_6292_1 [Eumeta japonica]|uniref:Uncharacterized protein n=1 Tax=Eumeta variegata TaxID=151549 RepID=A0A4C1TBE8_EUMVA|nr:hypothetical protein EVAR_6292_1 [Eumeta japonica]
MPSMPRFSELKLNPTPEQVLIKFFVWICERVGVHTYFVLWYVRLGITGSRRVSGARPGRGAAAGGGAYIIHVTPEADACAACRRPPATIESLALDLCPISGGSRWVALVFVLGSGRTRWKKGNAERIF